MNFALFYIYLYGFFQFKSVFNYRYSEYLQISCVYGFPENKQYSALASALPM